MIVVERLTLSSVYRLLRLTHLCSCRTIALLSGTRLTRLLAQAFGIKPVQSKHKGKGSVVASFVSVRVAEQLLSKNEIDSRVVPSLLAFFRDANIKLAYSKIVAEWAEDKVAHYQAVVYEATESGCTHVAFIPGDRGSYQLLCSWRELQDDFSTTNIDVHENKAGFGVAWLASYMYSCAAALALLFKVLAILCRQGFVIRSPKRPSYLVAMHNYWTVGDGPWDIKSADFLVDGEVIRKTDVLIIMSREEEAAKQRSKYTEAGIAWSNLCGPPVPIKALKDILTRLFQSLLPLWIPGRSIHSLLCRRLVGLIIYGLNLEVFLHHYHIRVFLNCEPQSPRHIVETVILNKFGGRTAWIPYSIALRTGFSSSHLYYNLFPVQGSFVTHCHGKTWSPRMVIRPIGMPSNDGANLRSEELATNSVRRRVQHIKSNCKIVGAFTGSYTRDQFVIERYCSFLRVLAKLTEEDSTLRVILKPKARSLRPAGARFLFEPLFHTIINGAVEKERIILLNPGEGLNCTAQYLIEASDIVVSTGQYAAFGTVWVEALLLDKPSYVFAPSVFRRSSFFDQLFDRWFFDREEALVEVVLQALASQNVGPKASGDNIQDSFDPFRDGRAIERFRNEILALANG